MKPSTSARPSAAASVTMSGIEACMDRRARKARRLSANPTPPAAARPRRQRTPPPAPRMAQRHQQQRTAERAHQHRARRQRIGQSPQPSRATSARRTAPGRAPGRPDAKQHIFETHLHAAPALGAAGSQTRRPPPQPAPAARPAAASGSTGAGAGWPAPRRTRPPPVGHVPRARQVQSRWLAWCASCPCSPPYAADTRKPPRDDAKNCFDANQDSADRELSAPHPKHTASTLWPSGSSRKAA